MHSKHPLGLTHSRGEFILLQGNDENIQKSHLKKSEKGLKGSADLPVKDIQDWGKLPFTNMSTWLDKVNSDATMKDF